MPSWATEEGCRAGFLGSWLHHEAGSTAEVALRGNPLSHCPSWPNSPGDAEFATGGWLSGAGR